MRGIETSRSAGVMRALVSRGIVKAMKLSGGADPRLAEIAQALAERVRPELVVLFGSHMRGDARPDSDYDLAVIVCDAENVEAVRVKAYESMRAISVYADVLVWRASEYAARQLDPGFLDSLVATDGVLLYASGNVPQRSPLHLREPAPQRSGVTMWLERAESDLRAAQHSLTAREPSIDAVCFHAHTAVEKFLKAMVVRHTNRFPRKTHDLIELLQSLSPEVRFFNGVAEACQTLMSLYPNSRYPENDMPTLSEAAESLVAASLVADAVRPMLVETV